MKRGIQMSEKLSNEIRNFMEHTNQTLAEQIEKLNQALLQALQNMGDSINDLKNNNNSGGRDISSNHSENNGATCSQVPKPSFLPRESPSTEEGEWTTNTAIENARTYANLEPEIRELITFREFCEANRKETHKKERSLQNQDFRSKVNKVTLPNFYGSKKFTERAWLQN